jgi:hypothetical protein
MANVSTSEAEVLLEFTLHNTGKQAFQPGEIYWHVLVPVEANILWEQFPDGATAGRADRDRNVGDQVCAWYSGVLGAHSFPTRMGSLFRISINPPREEALPPIRWFVSSPAGMFPKRLNRLAGKGSSLTNLPIVPSIEPGVLQTRDEVFR